MLTNRPDALALLHQLPHASWLLDAQNSVLATSFAVCERWPHMHWPGIKLSELIAEARFDSALAAARAQDGLHIVHDCSLRCPGQAAVLLQSLTLTPLAGLAPAQLLVSASFRDAQTAAPELLARDMARALAHEVRNPLGGLRGIAQLLQAKLPEYAEHTELLILECDRIAALVQRLLHERPPAREFANPHGPIDRALKLIAHEFPQCAQLLRDFDPSLPELALDVDALTQAILNLLRNAIEAGASKIRVVTRVQHRVELGALMLRTALRIDVEDNGHGVPEALRDRLFLPLVTGKSEGTGFGLATTLAIVESHGGGMRFQSESGRSVFSLFLAL